ncbi:MAG: cytochrome P450 [Treponema sp.]|nr:cytochrome P450 [Treponema sp.]
MSNDIRESRYCFSYLGIINYIFAQHIHEKNSQYIHILLKNLNDHANLLYNDYVESEYIDLKTELFFISYYTMGLFSFLIYKKKDKVIKNIIQESNILNNNIKTIIKKRYSKIMKEAEKIIKDYYIKNKLCHKRWFFDLNSRTKSFIKDIKKLEVGCRYVYWDMDGIESIIFKGPGLNYLDELLFMKKGDNFNENEIDLNEEVIEILNILYNNQLTRYYNEIRVNGKKYEIENNNKLFSKFMLCLDYPEDSEYYGIRKILDLSFSIQYNFVEVNDYYPSWRPLSGGGKMTVLFKKNKKWEMLYEESWMS